MIKLVSLNIERSKRLDLVIPFLRSTNADVICLQELMDYDIPRFEEALGMSHVYSPGKIHPAEGKPGKFGEGLFSRLPILRNEISYYHGNGELVESDLTDEHTKSATESCAVLFCEIEQDGGPFKIATTHFTWTPDGRPNDHQREDMKKMLDILADAGEFVLCGDFNAPRGGEIFAMLAEKYKDNIPLEYKTSIDVNLHRAGKIASEEMDKKMVDGVFSTPGYVVSNVVLHDGVSDHLAITANVTKAESA